MNQCRKITYRLAEDDVEELDPAAAHFKEVEGSMIDNTMMIFEI